MENKNDLKLKSILMEMPMLGHLLSLDMIRNIEKSLNVKLKNDDLIFSEFVPTKIGDNLYFIESEAGGDKFKRLLVIFKKEKENELCFAALVEQFQEKIEGHTTFKIRFSNRCSLFDGKLAAKAYLTFIKKNDVLICSDTNISKDGSWMWMEILTRPDLNAEVFVWNISEKKRENALTCEDIFGESEKYRNFIVVLKNK
jgi:hypothetical protein